ncbi:TIGR03915 family putative DNA repair protein [Taibaiella koreensis]|uniref:TIGR03915 family putative DNA repair protein n=1 Tax=Taibaiella koreensis TaxID=1268548 RepID=UPI000E5A0880|nr:TIGR03915 family putative DNA repair protein [Taibaiella koreensis]
MYYVFDGSYAGFLCVVFESFERKAFDTIPITASVFQSDFFREHREVLTDAMKAKRVQQGLARRLGEERARDFFRVFLSEDPQAWLSAYKIMLQLFRGDTGILGNYGDTDVLYFAQTLKKVDRERHRWKAFTRFSKSNDGLYFAVIEPDYNVLPLVTGFFRKRYADQAWLIYDVSRHYGIAYDTRSVSEVQMTKEEEIALPQVSITILLDERDAFFQRLWQQYFKSTNIEARKNLKLHLQHVPKRYWKYLPEKQ